MGGGGTGPRSIFAIKKTRYGLVVTLKTQNVDLDIYTRVEMANRTPIAVGA
jgi:hypothetical protein